ncbi:MAG: hypothetical protein Q9227_007055 [Pyrenula ochraceoflavens]
MSSECDRHLNKSLRPPPVPSDSVGDILSPREYQAPILQPLRESSKPLKVSRVQSLPTRGHNVPHVYLIAFLSLTAILVLTTWLMMISNERPWRPRVHSEPTEERAHAFPTWVPNSAARSVDSHPWKSSRAEFGSNASPMFGMEYCGSPKETAAEALESFTKLPFQGLMKIKHEHEEDDEGDWLSADLSCDDTESIYHQFRQSEEQIQAPQKMIQVMPSDSEVTASLQAEAPTGPSYDLCPSDQSATSTINASEYVEQNITALNPTGSSSTHHEPADSDSKCSSTAFVSLEGYTIKGVLVNGTIRYAVRKVSAQELSKADITKDIRSARHDKIFEVEQKMQYLNQGLRARIQELLYERNRADQERRLYEWSLESINIQSPEEADPFGFQSQKVTVIFKKERKHRLSASQSHQSNAISIQAVIDNPPGPIQEQRPKFASHDGLPPGRTVERKPQKRFRRPLPFGALRKRYIPSKRT